MSIIKVYKRILMHTRPENLGKDADMEKINLSDGEWRLMNILWQNPPRTITQLTRELDTGWGKNVIITMLNRLEAKGAVHHEAGLRAKQFYPAVDREGVAMEETKGFLNRVYQGSLSLMVNAMVDSCELSSEDIDELRSVLQKAEEVRHDDIGTGRRETGHEGEDYRSGPPS